MRTHANSRKTTMRERANGVDPAMASKARDAQSELPALLLPQPKPPKIDDPDCGESPIVEPVNRPPPPQEARSKPDPDNANTHAGGESA